MSLASHPLLRRLLLPLFARLNPGDITIKHHHTGAPVRLHSFRHKGYWWHGAKREAETMEAFRRVLRPGDTVIEVGAHIGYIALFFSHLVGPRGRVITFEPGENNLPYVRANVARHPNVRLVEKAVGDRAATMKLNIENLTGQNNSLIDHFEGLAANQRAAAVATEVRAVDVEVITLDSFCTAEALRPALLKIDVEGFEHEVLLGAREVLATHRPIVMVEVALADILASDTNLACRHLVERQPELVHVHTSTNTRFVTDLDTLADMAALAQRTGWRLDLPADHSLPA